MKALKNIGVTVAIVLVVYFGLAVFTYPTGALAAIADPWEAITLLTERVTQLEWRVARVEKLLGLDQERPASLYTKEDVENSPFLPAELREKVGENYDLLYSTKSQVVEAEYYCYIGKVPADLAEELEVKYNFWIEVLPPWEKGLPIRATLQMWGMIENRLDQTLALSFTRLWTLKRDGEILYQWEDKPLPGEEPEIWKPKEKTVLGFAAGLEDIPTKLDINSILVELELIDVQWEIISEE